MPQPPPPPHDAAGADVAVFDDDGPAANVDRILRVSDSPHLGQVGEESADSIDWSRANVSAHLVQRYS
jgi:hypothetical protein